MSDPFPYRITVCWLPAESLYLAEIPTLGVQCFAHGDTIEESVNRVIECAEHRMKWRREQGEDMRNTYSVSPGINMTASCHHRRKGQSGACGACYARLYVTLHEIERMPDRAPEILRACFDSMKAEAKS